MHALIDGDIIVYRCGFAVESKEEDGSISVEPLPNCLHSVKLMVNNILDKVGADSYTLFLTGKDNFRTKIDPEYKANRKDKRKPHYYEDIRNYMLHKFGAEVVDGMEADDAMGLAQTPKSIICSIDKDLLMIEGQHYNFVKDEHILISPEEANFNFYKQMLTGDTVDNIKGIYRLGDKKAGKLLDEHEDWDMLIYDKYCEQFEKPLLKMKQNALLLWIRNSRDIPINFRRFK